MDVGKLKNGVSSYELARMLGITQRSACGTYCTGSASPMQSDGFDKMIGEVEVDETLHWREGPQHAQGRSARYLDEQMFRCNDRKGKDADRFRLVAAATLAKRLTYRELTVYEDAGTAA